MPRLSQRREPLTTTPNSATPTSSTTASDVERHRGARERLRRDVRDDPHQRPARSRGSRAACVTRVDALVGGGEQRDEPDADDRDRAARTGSGRSGASSEFPRRGPSDAPIAIGIVLVTLVLRLRAAARRSPAPGSACRRAGSSRAPCARSAPPPARRSRRSRPAPRARSAACRRARRRRTTRGRAGARRSCVATYFSPLSENTCAVPVLPPRTYLRAGERARARAFLVHADQRVLDDARCSGFTGERVRRLARDRAHVAGLQVLRRCLTRCGRYATPSFATIAVACASCIGVNAL